MKYLRGLMLLCLFFSVSVQAKKPPKIAVTDLAYKETIREYIRTTNVRHRTSEGAYYNAGVHANPYYYSAGESGGAYRDTQTDISEVEESYSYIEFGELRKFVGDIKGGIIKKGNFRLSQAKPFPMSGGEKVYDIISRIKKGHFPGADYVLFGTVSELDFRSETQPIINTNSTGYVFNLMLVAEFSLINTRTYEVTAAFSAVGDGQDMRFITPGNNVVPSRGKVVAEVSKTLGEDVSDQLYQQVYGVYHQNNNYADHSYSSSTSESRGQEGQVIHYRK